MIDLVEKLNTADTSLHLKPGDEEVEQTVRLSRYEICKACDQLEQDWLYCKICLCYMPVKARLPLTSCPKNKW
jgi:hypothetical protein